MVIDDVTSELEKGYINVNDFVTRGSHMRTDVIIIYHGVPKATKPSLAPLRDNIERVILTGTDLISKIYDLTEWFDKSANTDKEVIEHCKKFVVRKRTLALVNKHLKEYGEPLEKYCVPFTSRLDNVDMSFGQASRFYSW